MMQRRFGAISRAVGVATLVVVLVGILAGHVAAHPLGNFTVNQYSRLEVTVDGPRIVHVVDMAEVPAFQEIQVIDTNGDGTISSDESSTYLSATLPTIASNLELTVDGQRVPVQATRSEITFPAGQAELKLLRIQATFEPVTPISMTTANADLVFTNTYAADRIGWREVVVTHGPGVTLAGTDVPATDTSRELTAYPEDLLASPLDQRTVSMTVATRADAPAAASFAAFQAGVAADGDAARPGGGTTGGRFAALLNGGDLSTMGLVLTLLAAMAWGAAHALSPGHGKTVVGAYLVGSRGTPRHAAFLGATVTITHTAGVLALGAITLFASQYILPETLFPWLSVVSGALVVVMGLWTLRMRLSGQPAFGHHHHHHHEHDHHHHHGHDHSHDHTHDHDHDHSHDHTHDHDGLVHSHGGHTHSHLPPTKISWKGLLALGVSGGLIPCPSALVVLLGAVALGRVGFGLALVVAFSLGLAATLTCLGLVFLYAGRFLERRIQPSGRIATIFRFAPAVGSVVLTVAGVAIIVRAIGETGLR